MTEKKDVKAAFAAYLRVLGVENPGAGREAADGQYHYSGTARGVETRVSFSPKDGEETFVIYRSAGGKKMETLGTITPQENGRYTLVEKAQKPAQGKSEEKQPPQEKPAAKAGAGTYSLSVVRDAQDEGKLETGHIVICKPDGTVAAKCKYKSGPFGKGHAPHVENYILDTSGNPDKNIRPFTPYPTKKEREAGIAPTPQDGLRISNDSFRNTHPDRNQILIHRDDGTPGTLGCFGIEKADWDRFKTTWDAIPASQRPDAMQPMSREELARRQALQVSLFAEQTRTGTRLALMPFDEGFAASAVPGSHKPRQIT